ncbi:MAG: hypothetical protein JNK47_20285 [Mesorhizobium sp.]|nr:hypothetical protein [Mesorhizobium sp.]MBL8579550.1 hypothetical protein [Mesorhizobium sp.]
MATVQQAVSRLSIEATSRGVDEATRGLQRLSSAQQGVAVTGEQVERVQTSVDSRLASIQRRYDSTFRAQSEYARAERTLITAQQQGLITLQRRAELLSMVAERHGLATSAINREAAATNQLAVAQARLGANDNSNYRRQNLGYQVADIGQGLAMGAPVGMIAAQQLPQIVQLYAAQGGLNAAMKDFIGILGAVVRVAGPWIAAAGALYGAYKLISSYGVDASLAIDDTTRALAEQAMPLSTLQSQITDLQRVQKAYTDAISLTADKQTAATATIIANSEREFKAKQSLLELELKRQQAAIAMQNAELAIAGRGLQREVGQGVMTRSDLEARGMQDPRIGSVPFVRVPDDVSGLAKTQDVIDGSGLNDKIKELKANLELTEIGAKALEDALKTTFDSTTVNAAKASDEAGKAAERYREMQDRRLEQLRFSLMSEEEQARVGYANQLVDLQEFYEAKLLSDADYYELVERARAEHEERMGQIVEQRAQAESRQRTEMYSNVATTLSGIASIIDAAGEKNLTAAKAFGVASALVNTYIGITNVLADRTLIGPARWAAVAAVAATGFAQVASIASVSKGGGARGGGAAGGSGGAASASSAPAQPQQAITINLHGDTQSTESVEALLQKINDATADGHKLIVRAA